MVLLDVDVDAAVVTPKFFFFWEFERTASLLVGKRRLPLARSEREGCRADDENMSSRLSLSSLRAGKKCPLFFQFHFPKNLTFLPDAGFETSKEGSKKTRIIRFDSSSSSSSSVSSDWRNGATINTDR